ncbi:hypothetical protein [Flavobacterium sharifuzzamanii]|uniref:hypothetical protein n=1 Tax=Flavobacterium sharifuzzamanii TaxID=2211133 RepID=UPI000DAE1A87|nr:hypothetical protein [Flavobacterium sharifuzzamanii]KAF2082095.1 hypothetical protein DMA14_06390 [Flavobacterium sharifuzzamanii]
MKKVISLFDQDKLSDLNYEELNIFKTNYLKLLTDNPFPVVPNLGSHYEMITFLKRKDESNPVKIGVYENISPFEAANRIASDLVILNGLLQLIAANNEIKDAKFTLRLGTTHHVGKGDFTIKIKDEEFEGEAFNAAPSFLKQKMRKTLKKWEGSPRLRYILVNVEAFEFIGASKIDSRVFKVENWHL